MSKPEVLYWAPSGSNLATIGPVQSLAAAGALTIVSNQYNSQVSTNGAYVFEGCKRNVALSSVPDNSARTFTITGYGSAVDVDGNPTDANFSLITETINGPNNSSVFSANIYKSIVSITASGAVDAVSIGFGSQGVTDYIFLDYNRTAFYATCQAQIINPVTLTYTTYVTLTKPQTPNIEFGNLDNFPYALPAFPIATMTNANDNQIAQIPYPVVATWVNISDNSGVNESLYFTVLQQGLRS
jgi:hypothetical protein